MQIDAKNCDCIMKNISGLFPSWVITKPIKMVLLYTDMLAFDAEQFRLTFFFLGLLILMLIVAIIWRTISKKSPEKKKR